MERTVTAIEVWCQLLACYRVVLLLVLPWPIIAEAQDRVLATNYDSSNATVEFTKELSPSSYPVNAFGAARLSVVYTPKIPVFYDANWTAIRDSLAIRYQINNSKLGFQLHFKRDRKETVNFTVSVQIADKSGKVFEFAREDSLASAGTSQTPRAHPTSSMDVPVLQPMDKARTPAHLVERPSAPPVSNSMVRFVREYWMLLLLAAAALALTLLGVTLTHQVRRRARSIPQPLPPVRVSGYPAERDSFARSLEAVRADARRALEKSQQVEEAFASVRASTSRSDLNIDPKRLQNQLDRLGATIELDTFIARAQRFSSGSSGDGPNTRPASTEEKILVACANHGIERGSVDRKWLLEITRQAGLPGARLVTHKNASKTLSEVTRSIYEFETSERDGGWLWFDQAVGSESLTVPVAADFFWAGRGSELLDRLFEGMPNAPEGFRFRKIYRACRLRSSDNGTGYSLKDKGALQLQDSPPPNLPPPPEYSALISGDHSEIFGPSPTFVTAVAGSLDTLDNRMRKLERFLGSHTANQLSSRVATLEQEQGKSAHFIQELQSQLGRIGKISRDVELFHQDVRARLHATEQGLQLLKSDIGKLTSMFSSSEDRCVQPGIEEAIVDGNRIKSEVDSPRETRTARFSAARLPEAWQQPIRDSFDGGQLTEDQFALRLGLLREQLATCAQVTANIVHLTVASQNDTWVDVHEVDPEPSSDGQFSCPQCQMKVPSYQTAVCVGATDGQEISVLYPLGDLNPSKYPAIYRLLVKNLKHMIIEIRTINAPAVLLLKSKDDCTFSVKSQMEWE